MELIRALLQRAQGFLQSLARCLESGGVHVIDLPIDYSDNSRALGAGAEEAAR